jgi:3-hydroxyacyl-CoA dehydrogenase
MAHGIQNVGVIGLGVMGFDIAFLYAMKGFRTVAHDASQPVMASFSDRREQTVERLRKRNRISDHEMENVRTCLTLEADLASFRELELITEAVSENAGTKLAVYQALRACGFPGILTTNTSSLARETLLAGGVFDRKRFLLTHFFNPVLHTRMVEIVKGDVDESSRADVLSFLKKLGREPVETEDISGFVSNSILMYYAVMALQLLQCGAAVEEVDGVAKKLGLLPPFISFDSWKPSIVEDVTRVMFELRGDDFLRSSELLSVLAKNNPKFYLDQKPNETIYRLIEKPRQKLSEASIARALKSVILVAAARVVELGESPATVDFVATEGIRIPQAPLLEIDSAGVAAVIREISTLNQDLPAISLAPPALLIAMARAGQTFYKNGAANPWLLSQVKPASHHASH